MKAHTVKAIRDDLIPKVVTSWTAPILDELIARGADVYICAGAVRDTLALHESGLEISIRDFDIGVCGISRDYFNGIMGEFRGTRNKYGGYELSPSHSPKWDVWRMEDTVGLKKRSVPFSLEAVLRSFVLNFNAIALDLRRGTIWDCGALAAFRRRQIGFANHPIVHSRDTFASKAMLLSLRYHLSLSAEMRTFVERNLTQTALRHEATKSLGRCFTIPECLKSS